MSTTIALFQGINVGGRHRLPMKDLTAILQELGCQNVQTYIQSGNVVFTSPKKDARKLGVAITASIAASHGFAPKVWLLPQAELQDAIDHNPFPTDVGKALHFFFLDEEPTEVDWDKLKSLQAASEDCRLHKKVFYLHAPDGIGRSKLVDKLGQCIRVPMTARNWNTVAKLIEMAG